MIRLRRWRVKSPAWPTAFLSILLLAGCAATGNSGGVRTASVSTSRTAATPAAPSSVSGKRWKGLPRLPSACLLPATEIAAAASLPVSLTNHAASTISGPGLLHKATADQCTYLFSGPSGTGVVVRLSYADPSVYREIAGELGVNRIAGPRRYLWETVGEALWYNDRHLLLSVQVLLPQPPPVSGQQAAVEIANAFLAAAGGRG